MGIRRWRKIRKIKKKRRKAVKKIKDAVQAFLYLNRALIRAGVSRTGRRQLRRDLINSNKPEDILSRFLQEIKKVAISADEKDDEEKENDED